LIDFDDCCLVQAFNSVPGCYYTLSVSVFFFLSFLSFSRSASSDFFRFF
jgi:hypothetical protein